MPNLPPQLTGQAQSPMQGVPQGMPQMEGMMGKDNQNSEEPQKIVAHFSLDELQDIDKVLLELLQGIYNKPMPQEVLFDPETGLRNYTPLDEILRKPEIESAFTSAIGQGQQNFATGGEVEPGRPTDPELEKLRLQGGHGDTELAIITPFIMEKFSEWAGKEPTINQETGLPEFGFFGGFFRTVARVVAPIVGAVFGGPVGAALAGGLATKLTGGSWGQALGAGAISGLGAWAAPGIGGVFQSQFPGLSSGLGQATRGIFGETIGGGLGNLFTPSAGGAGIVSPMAKFGLGSAGQMIPGMGGQAAGQAGIQAAGQTGGGFLSSLLGGPLPLIGSGLLMAKGHKEEQKGLRDYQNALQQQEQQERGRSEAMREKLGFNAKLNPLEPYRRRQIPTNLTREEYARGVEPVHFENYAQGGAVRGIGKGQQDNIPTNLKEGSYIIDASTVSDIGDGSSNAGIRELDRYFSRVPTHGMQNEARGGIIKAMVSPDEYRISPEQVTAIGKGSNEKGAKILKNFVSQVRKKKRTSGQKLPPKSKPIGGYLKNINRSVG